MILFYQDHIIKAMTMVFTTPNFYRLLVDRTESGRSFSCFKDF